MQPNVLPLIPHGRPLMCSNTYILLFNCKAKEAQQHSMVGPFVVSSNKSRPHPLANIIILEKQEGVALVHGQSRVWPKQSDMKLLLKLREQTGTNSSHLRQEFYLQITQKPAYTSEQVSSGRLVLHIYTNHSRLVNFDLQTRQHYLQDAEL